MNLFKQLSRTSILLLVICSFAKAQPKTMQLTQKKYFSIINEAELLIGADRYKEALVHYDLAFRTITTPWGKDLYNAWMCAYILNDKGRFERYSIPMIKNGAMPDSMAYFTLSTCKQLSNSPRLLEYFVLWSKLKAEFNSFQIDTIYRNELLQLRNEDQQTRGFFIQKNEGDYNVVGKDSLNVFDSLNIIKLKNLIERKSFPTEQLVGYNHSQPSNVECLFDLVLLHDRSWTNRQTLDTILYQMVLEGKFHPLQYASLKDQSYISFNDSIAAYQEDNFAYYQTTNGIILDDSLYILKTSPERDKKADKSRNAIGLESVNELRYKTQFLFSHPEFNMLNSPFNRFHGLDVETTKSIKDNSISKNKINGFNTIRTRRCKYGLHH